MADVPFATVTALGAWVGETLADEDPRATALLRAASYLVASEVGTDVAEAWDEIPGEVASVVTQVAARVWFNPQGLVGDSIDDYTRRWDSPESGVYLTQMERDILSRYRVKGPRGLWTLGTTRGDDYADQYLDVVNAATPSTLEEPIPYLPPGE